MSLIAVGLSHNSAPLPVLERAALAAAGTPLLDRLRAAEHLTDVAVLATCNRVEVYADVTRFHGGVADVVRELSEAGGVDLDELTAHLYVHYDAAVAEHLFTVTAGLDSMAVGESQILGQVRSLWHAARAAGSAVPLDELFQQALRVGKRAQSETGLDRRSNALVDHALDRAAEMLGDPAPRTLVVGAGAMAAVVVSSLQRRSPDADPGRLTVVNRTRDAARRLSAGVGGAARTVPWEQLEAELSRSDLVVTCTGAIGHVVDGRHLAALSPGTRPERMVLVDLALPRDVDPLAAQVAGVTLLDLESLGAELVRIGGTDEVEAARRIVAAEVAGWRSQQAATGVAPTVVALREQARAILDTELDRLDRRLPDLPEDSRDEIRNAVRRVVEKVLHTPTVRVKELADAPGGSFYAEALRTLFDLEISDSTRAVPEAVATASGAPVSAARAHGSAAGGTLAQPAVIRVGTRSSALARAQSGVVADALAASLGRPARLVDVRTHGDVSRASLSVIGGVGVFVSALRTALAEGMVDIAVHSLKDLPTAPAAGIRLAAVPLREDPRDALVARDGLRLADLPPGARVGTGSPRRAALLAGRDLQVVDIRGNVDSRLARVGADLDAVVVAAAGLRRLGRLAAATELLDPVAMPPAPGQGALAVETRADDPLGDLVAEALDDAPTRLAVTAERALLAALETGCSAPVGALGQVMPVGTDRWRIALRAVAGLRSAPGGGTAWLGVTAVDGTAEVCDLAGAASAGARLGGELKDRANSDVEAGAP